MTSTCAYAAGHVSSIAHREGAQSLTSFAYAYDAAGQLSSVDGPRTDASDVTG